MTLEPQAYVDVQGELSDSRGFDRRTFLHKGAGVAVAAPFVASILSQQARGAFGRSDRRLSRAGGKTTLRIAVEGDFETLDPNNSSTPRATEMCANLYET